MSADQLLAHFDGVRQTGPGRWIAKCPAHDDTSPSLSVRLLDDGRVLLHCFAGCESLAVVQAVNLTLADLFPEPLHNPTHLGSSFPRERQPFSPMDTLRIIARECMVCALAASDAVAGRPVSEADAQRAALAVGRIFAALDAMECRP